MRAWSNMHRGKAPGCKPYSRRGFTLIELMVSLAGGLFLSITVFLVAKHTSALYQRETRIASTNVASVVGFERLRADLARAGFMSSPHIRRDPFVCGNPVGNAAWPVQLREMTSVRIDNIPEANLPNVLVDNGITPQTLLLSGNYSSAEAFPARAIVVSGTSFQIFLQQATGAMARIGYGAPGADNQAILTSVFPPGRAIRVVDNSGRSQFGTLTSVSTNPSPVLNIAGGQPNLIFRTSSTMGCGFKGEETGALVNAVNFFRYDLRNLSTDSRYAPLYPDPDTEVGPEYEDERTDLVREEIGPNGTAIPNTLELVTEYAVDLRFRLTVAPNQRSQLQYVQQANIPAWAGNPVVMNPNAGPQMIRTVHTWLSVRSREADRGSTVANPGGPLFRIGLGGGGNAPFARVRTVQARVALHNQTRVTWQ